MSTHRISPSAGWVVDFKSRPKGPNGRGLCRWCGSEVPVGCRTFCGDACIHRHKIRTDPGYVRQQVMKRDRGVCSACGFDTEKLKRALRWATGRYEFLREMGIRKDHLWEAHHVVPVSRGGGECGLDGYVTLCCLCHDRETASLRRGGAR